MLDSETGVGLKLCGEHGVSAKEYPGFFLEIFSLAGDLALEVLEI